MMLLKQYFYSWNKTELKNLNYLAPFILPLLWYVVHEATPENHPSIMEPNFEIPSKCFTIPYNTSNLSLLPPNWSPVNGRTS